MMPLKLGELTILILLNFMAIQAIQAQKTDSEAITVPAQQLNNLMQGRIYVPNYVRVVGSQFLTENWRMGEIKMLDEEYIELPIWYDIYTDDLILLDWQGLGYGMMRLNKEQIESFEFDGRRFINPSYGSYKNYILENKYYELIAEGTVSFLIRRNIKVQQDDSVDHFVRKDSKILIHSGEVFSFRNKKSFLKVIPPSTKDKVGQYIRKNKIRLKNAEDSEWTGIIVYINDLLGSKSEKE